MERITYRITLDAHRNGVQRLLQGFETGDTIARRIVVSLVAGGDTYEIPQDHVAALIYVTGPQATEPEIHDCEIVDDTIVYDVLPLSEEGVTQMQIKLIESGMEGAKKVLLAPKFAVEVVESNADDSEAEQTPAFTSLENAIAQAKEVYAARLLNVEIDADCTFRAYYADGTVYENESLKEAIHEGNALLAESFAIGGTGIREGEDEDNAKYYCEFSEYAAEQAKYYMEQAQKSVGTGIDLYAREQIAAVRESLGGWSIYEEELTQAEYDALPADLKSTPKLIFVIKKDGD